MMKKTPYASPIALLMCAATCTALGQVQQAGPVEPEVISTVGEFIPGIPEVPAAFLQDSADLAWLTIDRRDLEEVPSENILPQVPVDGVPFVVGINQKVSDPLTVENSGTWSVQPDGSWVWRLVVRQPEAVAIRVHLAQCDLPDEAEFVVGDPGGITVKRMTAFNAGPDGSLWTPPIPGDTMYIEYHCDEHPEGLPFKLVEAAHLWDESLGGSPYGPRGFGGCAVTPCQLDVMCFPPNAIARDSVGRMLFSVGPNQSFCTGTLINDSNPANTIPYFLTANHCISTQASASSLTVVWGYYSALCGGTPPNPATLPSTTGATLLANNSSQSSAGGTDMCFLQLATTPSSGAALAGWTTASPLATDVLTGIHHPAGCRKRISTFTLDPTPYLCTDRDSTHFYNLDPVTGDVQGGSSGSALFNPSWQVVGQLLGRCGESLGCGSTTRNMNYGRLDVAYPLIEPFMGPRYGTWGRPNTSQVAPDGTPARPFNVLTAQLALTPAGGRAWLYPSSSPTPVLINQSITIRSYGGVATIGR
jgi:hypothetical protein